jgi:hypothetical protein
MPPVYALQAATNEPKKGASRRLQHHSFAIDIQRALWDLEASMYGREFGSSSAPSACPCHMKAQSGPGQRRGAWDGLRGYTWLPARGCCRHRRHQPGPLLLAPWRAWGGVHARGSVDEGQASFRAWRAR